MEALQNGAHLIGLQFFNKTSKLASILLPMHVEYGGDQLIAGVGSNDPAKRLLCLVEKEVLACNYIVSDTKPSKEDRVINHGTEFTLTDNPEMEPFVQDKSDKDKAHYVYLTPNGFPIPNGTTPASGVVNETSLGVLDNMNDQASAWVDLRLKFSETAHNHILANKATLGSIVPKVKRGITLSTTATFNKLSFDEDIEQACPDVTDRLNGQLDDFINDNIKPSAKPPITSVSVPAAADDDEFDDGTLGGATTAGELSSAVASMSLRFIYYDEVTGLCTPPTFHEDGLDCLTEKRTVDKNNKMKNLILHTEEEGLVNSTDFADRMANFPGWMTYVSVPKSVPLFCDNNAAMAWSDASKHGLGTFWPKGPLPGLDLITPMTFRLPTSDEQSRVDTSNHDD